MTVHLACYPASSSKRTYSPSPLRALVSSNYSSKHHHHHHPRLCRLPVFLIQTNEREREREREFIREGNRAPVAKATHALTQGRTGIPSACDQGHPFTKVGDTLPFSQLFPGAVRLPERERSEARERAGQRGHGGKWPSEFCAAAFTLSQRPEVCAFRRTFYSVKASVATASCLHTWALRGGEPLYTIPGALSPCPRHVASCQRRTWAVCACWTQAA